MNFEYILTKLIELAEGYAATTPSKVDDAAVVVLKALLERINNRTVGAAGPDGATAYGSLPDDIQTDVDELLSQLESDPNG